MTNSRCRYIFGQTMKARHLSIAESTLFRLRRLAMVSKEGNEWMWYRRGTLRCKNYGSSQKGTEMGFLR